MAKQQLSKQTKMAMTSQFLGFMLDAYDMAMVLVMAPILVKVFVSPMGSAAWQYIVIVFSSSIDAGQALPHGIPRQGTVDKSTGVRSDHTVILTAMESAKVYPDALRRVTSTQRPTSV